MNNLHDLSRHPSPYSVPIVPCPLPSEVVEGEHFVTEELLNLIQSSLSLARESETEAAVGSWRSVFSPGNLPLPVRILALPLRRSDKLRGVFVWSIFPWQERAPVLPPNHQRKRRRRSSDRKLLEQRRGISFYGSLQYPAVPRIGKKKRKRSGCLI